MEYDINPAESIRGSVHIASADTSMDVLGDQVEGKKEVGSIHDGNSVCITQMFYLNRFYLNEDSICYSDEIKENYHES